MGHFFLDLAQLCLVLAARQPIRAQLLGDVLLKLTPQEPEIWISPYCPFAVFKLAGSNALDNEVPADAVFLFGRYIAEGCPFAIPFAVFRHVSSLRPNEDYPVCTNLHGQAGSGIRGYAHFDGPQGRLSRRSNRSSTPR